MPSTRPNLFNRLTAFLVLLLLGGRLMGATFHGTGGLTVADPSGAFAWNPANNALTIQCWFKISIPTGTNLTQNMTILVNGNNGSESQYDYLVRFNIASGNVEFLGQGGAYSNTLIRLPYLERWYHLAVVLQGSSFIGYVDGRQVFNGSGAAGSGNVNGLSIGCWGSGQYLFGEVQEVSIYQNALQHDVIVQNMFNGQPTNDPSIGLVGYFPIGYSTNSQNEVANFAPAPVPSGTTSAQQQLTGAVIFEQTDEGGEQSAFDAERNGGWDALAPLSGAFSWQQTAFARPTSGIAMDIRFGYSSANSLDPNQLASSSPYAGGLLGNGWRTTFEMRVIPTQYFSPLQDADSLGLMNWDGSIATWDLNYDTGNYEPRDNSYNGEIVITSTNCQWTTPERLVYVFRRPDSGSPSGMRGRLTAIHDFNGNVVQILWNQNSDTVTQVVDTASGIYHFNYQASLLTNITFGAWQVNFGYDATNRLTSKSVTNTAGLYAAAATTWQFQYGTNGFISTIIDPRGNTNVLVHYDQYGRQTNEVDALGRLTVTEYEAPGERQMTRIDAATNSWIESYDRKGHVLSQSDPLGNTTSFTYDGNGNRTSVTEPLGWVTTMGYDNRANMVAKTNALGEVNTWLIDGFFNKAIKQVTEQPPDTNGWVTWTNYFGYDRGGKLTNNWDALGSLVQYVYSTNGLVLSTTDANGHSNEFRYDTNGFLLAKTDAETNTTSYAVNDVGWKLKEFDAQGSPTSYTYDLNGHPTRILDVIGRAFNKTYDGNGNLLTTTDGNGLVTTYGYDAANQKTNMVDRTGTNKWSYFYTTRGKLDHVTDALGYSETNTYDAANRLVAVTDPLGQSITNQYDANGNLIAYFDKLGQRWVKGYDRLNRAISETDPLGDTKTTTYDMADRIQQITSPNGYPSTHSYDGRGRLIQWVDPQNFKWLYTYDGVGNITNITDALLGHYLMTYGFCNERLTELNQDTNKWIYTYDTLLRLQTQTDPNGTIRTPNYDLASRVLGVSFSTGRRDSYIYDNNDNPRIIKRYYGGVATDLQLIYDSLDRVVEQDDALGQTVLYGHDALGRVTSITYPGGKKLNNYYDALGRLTNQVDWVGRQLSYAYDPADRLIFRSYPNGVVQTNVFDTAGRITGLAYATPNPGTATNSAIQVALNYAYDRNGNKTGNSESGVFNWPLPSITDDNAAYTSAGKLINRQINNISSNQLATVVYHYDASGNMTNAVKMIGSTNAESWTLAYDEDNRTTAINWDGVMATVNITNRFDALGRRLSKTVNSQTTGYVLSLAGGMERVLCDLDGNGNVTAWYVHGPDLCYRVDATNGLLCYHADAQGNIIALTDGNKNVVAQYAYTPYGRSLGSTNCSLPIFNPYLFVGSQGVVEEIPGLYYMRARYFLANACVFVSTDPVKHIGPSWQAEAYVYATGNPLSSSDPSGMLPWIVNVIGGLDHQGNTLYCGPNYVAGQSISESELTDSQYQEFYDNPETRPIRPDDISCYNHDKSFAHPTTLLQRESINENFAAAQYNASASYLIGGDFVDSSQSFMRGLFSSPIPHIGLSVMTIVNEIGVMTSMPDKTVSSVAQNSTLNATQATTKSSPTGNNSGAPNGGGGVTTSSGDGGISTTYVVKQGDTLGNIAYANGTTATALGAANGIQNLNIIHPGQVITIHH